MQQRDTINVANYHFCIRLKFSNAIYVNLSFSCFESDSSSSSLRSPPPPPPQGQQNNKQQVISWINTVILED